MKARFSLVFGLALCLAFTSTAFADFSDSSADSGGFDVGTDFTSTITVAPSETITDVVVNVNMDHSWVGDITLTLTHVDTGTSIALIASGGDSTNLGIDAGGNVLSPAAYVFSDAGAEDIATAVAPLGNDDELGAGTFLATASLAATFAGEDIMGDWLLTANDNAGGDPGNIAGWGLAFTSTANVPEPGSIALIGMFGVACVVRRRR